MKKVLKELGNIKFGAGQALSAVSTTSIMRHIAMISSFEVPHGKAVFSKPHIRSLVNFQWALKTILISIQSSYLRLFFRTGRAVLAAKTNKLQANQATKFFFKELSEIDERTDGGLGKKKNSVDAQRFCETSLRMENANPIIHKQDIAKMSLEV